MSEHKHIAGMGDRCCTTCKWHKTVAGHPWNEKFKGSVTEQVAIACCLPELTHIILFEFNHEESFCEMWEKQ